MADKELEAWYVERLRTLWPDFPSGPRSSSENPDVLVRSSDRVVGVEITTFTLNSENNEQPIRERLSVQSRILARARELYRAGGGPVLIVDVEFESAARLTKRDVQGIAGEIASRLLAHPFAENDSPDWYQEIPPPLPRGVLSIAGGLYRLAESWDTSIGILMRDITVQDIQQVINKKAARYEAYRAQCDTVILLIAFSSEHEPRVDIGSAVLQHPYQSPFDATIALLDDIPAAVVLRTIPQLPNTPLQQTNARAIIS